MWEEKGNFTSFSKSLTRFSAGRACVNKPCFYPLSRSLFLSLFHSISSSNQFIVALTGAVGPHLTVGLQIVVEDVDGDGQVASVERIAPVPALRSKLSPLSHHGVEVAQRKQDAFKLIFTSAHLQRVLSKSTQLWESFRNNRVLSSHL